MDASKLDKKLLTKYLMENPHDNLPYFAYKVKEVINFLLYIDEAGEGYKTAAYTKPYSFFDSCYDAGERMLIFLTHRGDHES